jgi:hypothetical protein
MIEGSFSRRALTAIVVLLACGLAIFRGWQITRLVHAATGDLPVTEKREILSGLAQVTGLAQYALAELRRLPAGDNAEATPADEKLRLTKILLSQAPLSSLNWLELCNRRLAAGEKLNRVLQAFELSSLTGRNEGYVMYRRAPVGIALWDALPESGKRVAVNDVAQTLNEMPGDAIARIKQALANQSEEMRGAFRAALVTAGMSSDRSLKLIGL